MSYKYNYLAYESAFAELSGYCKQYDIDISPDSLNGCLQHLDYMLGLNEKVNLTSITDPHDALILHVLDSLLLLPWLNDAPPETFLDLGTGGGFPGIPLALASRRHAVLLDSVKKKVAAVQSVIESLGLCDVQAVHDRVENYARDHRSSCAAVVARAVAPLPILIEYASPLLIDNGTLIVTKGIPSKEEIDSGERAAALCGMVCEFVTHTDLPHHMGARSIILYKKVMEPKIRLPRAVGIARKRPLA